MGGGHNYSFEGSDIWSAHLGLQPLNSLVFISAWLFSLHPFSPREPSPHVGGAGQVCAALGELPFLSRVCHNLVLRAENSAEGVHPKGQAGPSLGRLLHAEWIVLGPSSLTSPICFSANRN